MSATQIHADRHTKQGNIVIDGCFLASYGKGASWIAQKLRSQHKVWVDRAAGASLITAAVLLGLRTNERT